MRKVLDRNAGRFWEVLNKVAFNEELPKDHWYFTQSCTLKGTLKTTLKTLC